MLTIQARVVSSGAATGPGELTAYRDGFVDGSQRLVRPSAITQA
jgi:hypothetical protein